MMTCASLIHWNIFIGQQKGNNQRRNDILQMFDLLYSGSQWGISYFNWASSLSLAPLLQFHTVAEVELITKSLCVFLENSAALGLFKKFSNGYWQISLLRNAITPSILKTCSTSSPKCEHCLNIYIKEMHNPHYSHNPSCNKRKVLAAFVPLPESGKDQSEHSMVKHMCILTPRPNSGRYKCCSTDVTNIYIYFHFLLRECGQPD